MRILKRRIEKNGEGQIKIIVEDPDDLWNLFNLLAYGDRITASTYRKVQKQYSTGSTSTQRIKLTLTISIEDIDFDSMANSIRVKGKNVIENDHVKLGQYHTMEIHTQDTIGLHKPVWDSLYLDRLREATDPTKVADLAVVVMEPGLANICLITKYMTIFRLTVEQVIPKKRLVNERHHEKSIEKFYISIYEGIIRNINFDVCKCVVIASPAFWAEEFLSWMLSNAQRKNEKVILDNRSKFMNAHSTSGQKHTVKEVLSDQNVINRISDTKASSEVSALNQFMELLGRDPDRAHYGPKEVERVINMGVVDQLLISDELFRARDIPTRRKYINLVEKVKDNNGTVHIFSSYHVSGEQLSKMSGFAAILRYPVPDLDDSDDEKN